MAAFTAALVTGGGVWAVVLAIAIPLALFGTSDIADGYLAWRTGIDRSWRKIREGAAGRRLGLAKIGWGASGCFVALCRLMAFAPASRSGSPAQTTQTDQR